MQKTTYSLTNELFIYILLKYYFDESLNDYFNLSVLDQIKQTLTFMQVKKLLSFVF